MVRVVDLVRQRVAEETVLGCWRELDGSWQYWIDGARRIGYVRLTRIGPTTAGVILGEPMAVFGVGAVLVRRLITASILCTLLFWLGFLCVDGL